MKTIVVITGASSGIGQAAALHLSGTGSHVLAGVRREEDAAAWNGRANVTPVLLDVTREESVHAASRLPLLEGAERVHLVNNAGIAVGGPVEGVPLARWREQFEVNVFGLVRVTQAFLPHIRRTRGRIVNISSVSGLAAAPYLAPYASSKFAVEAISDSLRRELRQFGVSVAVVEPGPIATPIWEKSLGKKNHLLSELPSDLRQAYARQLEKFQSSVEESARSAVQADKVSQVIGKALTARRPRTRYVVGAKGLRAQMAIFGLLPDTVVDGLVARSLR
jgi:NAD(P)-dependent dehydrogenase (short-subunit alcohol dehydrogenase family)